MSSHKEHAFREFKAAGWLDADGEFKCKMQKMICDHVMKLLDVFNEEGHSGSSAPYAIGLFSKLAAFEPVVPLTGEHWEWNAVGDGVFQNNRCGHVFKNASRFGGRPYDNDAVIFYDWYVDPKTGEKSKSFFTSRESARVIEFPYTPERKYEERHSNQ